jgi:hypothetical protein
VIGECGRGARYRAIPLSLAPREAYGRRMDKDALNQISATVPDHLLDPDIVPVTLPDPAAVDDGDEEDGRL